MKSYHSKEINNENREKSLTNFLSNIWELFHFIMLHNDNDQYIELTVHTNINAYGLLLQANRFNITSVNLDSLGIIHDYQWIDILTLNNLIQS